jgi:hypothetical protein
MALFTCLMEYEGGLYFSQVRAVSVRAACMIWARKLDVSQVKGFGAKSKLLLIEEMKEESKYLVSIDGVINVWCTSALVRNKLVLVDFIQTEQGEPSIS